MDTQEFDVIVIGAGPVGENVADRVVQNGLSAVIVESELVGGECSYWACMPSKALLRPGAALDDARSVSGAAQAVTGELDVPAVFVRRDEFVHHGDDASQVEWLRRAGITLVRGRGRVHGVREVVVSAPDHGELTLTARHAVVIATGSAALMPDVPGLADARPWTSREATSATEVPDTLAIVGGGVVACEMATFFAAAGSTVTVLSPGPLLGHSEPFAGEAVAQRLRERGATITHARVVGAERSTTTTTTILTLDDGSTIGADQVLVAAGRTPRTIDLGLDALHVDDVRDGAWLSVDDTMLVSGTDWLYAVGDVNHRALLTHQGKYQARAAGDVIAARARGGDVDDGAWGAHVATADHRCVPQVVFTAPPVASVGLTDARARQDGLSVSTIDYDLGDIAGAATFADGYRGRARVVIDTERDVVVGATFVGPGVEEMVHAATIAIVGEVPISRLWHAVPAYPTISEVWLRWLETYGPASAVHREPR